METRASPQNVRWRWLYLLAAKEKGRRHAWRLDYTFEMVRKTISLDVYPNVSLKLARQKAREAQ